MLHFDGHTLSIKKVMFAMKSGEYFEKDNIYGVNFDSGICISIEYINVISRIYDPNQFLYFKTQFLCKNGNKWHLLSRDMPIMRFT